MYSSIRNILFYFPPEIAHELCLKFLRFIPSGMFTRPKNNPINVMGIEFPHRIGLAAGFDKNAEYLDSLSKLGFSFIEVGTVTLNPQVGNPKPRLFRLPHEEAIINRMGFNNFGVDVLVENIKKSSYQGILGVNIGKNKNTSLARAADDYMICLQKVYPYASYVTINISSPNTSELRKLQGTQYLGDLLKKLRQEQLELANRYNRYVPLVLKISPDESDEVLKNIVEMVLKNKISAIIATNTSVSRANISNCKYKNEIGGLSGRPIIDNSTSTLRTIKKLVGSDVGLIGSGGINSITDAKAKIEAGAEILQLYTGLIYHGPNLIIELCKALARLSHQNLINKA